jgi:hypothetical protein
MAIANGFQCKRDNFRILIRNPVYCGIVTVPPNKFERLQFVKGVHEPLISEKLFYDVQLIINSDRKLRSSKDDINLSFPLRGFLICPQCHRKLTASISKGKCSRYRYYHCDGSVCKNRYRAEVLNEAYEDQLRKLRLKPEVYELFKLVLEDQDIFSNKRRYINERKAILNEITDQQLLMSKARRFFLNEKMDFDDFCKLKKELNEISDHLSTRLDNVTRKLIVNGKENGTWQNSAFTIFQSYKNQDIKGKRDIISLFTPSLIDPVSRNLEPSILNLGLSMTIDHVKDKH